METTRLTPAPGTATARILEYLDTHPEGVPSSRIAEATGVGVAEIGAYLSVLEAAGQVFREKAPTITHVRIREVWRPARAVESPPPPPAGAAVQNVLALLRTYDGQTQAAVEQRVRSSRSQISKWMRALEELGLVSGVKVTGRAKAWSMTEAGHDLLVAPYPAPFTATEPGATADGEEQEAADDAAPDPGAPRVNPHRVQALSGGGRDRGEMACAVVEGALAPFLVGCGPEGLRRLARTVTHAVGTAARNQVIDDLEVWADSMAAKAADKDPSRAMAASLAGPVLGQAIRWLRDATPAWDVEPPQG